jgi:N-acetyl-gamma-glutamylphosphate reductase
MKEREDQYQHDIDAGIESGRVAAEEERRRKEEDSIYSKEDEIERLVIETKIQNLTADANTNEKKSNTSQSGTKKCEKCKEPTERRYTVIDHSTDLKSHDAALFDKVVEATQKHDKNRAAAYANELAELRTWYGKKICEDCREDMYLDSEQYETE